VIDTHSHIYDEAFDADRSEVLARARNAGINKVFLPNINADTLNPMLSLCRDNPGFCYPMLGLHPEDVRDDWSCCLDEMETQLSAPSNPFIAIGEVGLDFYWDQTFRDQQLQAFRRQVLWAVRYGLPLMIHSRDAHRDIVEVLTELLPDGRTDSGAEGGMLVRGVFHCFGGTADEAAELLSFPGFMLGIGGVVTYKNSRLPEVLRTTVPLSRIVLETDSPYLAPVPHRGRRNETAYICHVAQRLADIYEVSMQKVTQITTQNALKTFDKAA